MSNEGYRDRILTCRDCGQEFAFTAGEQEFYASRGLTNVPARCSGCRVARRNGGQQHASNRGYGGERERFETICASCGQATTVPFVPSGDRPVYCSDCFQAQRASRGGSYHEKGYGNGGGSGYGDRGGNSYGDRRGGRRDSRQSRW